jgi:hypothetical protein
MTKAQLEEIVGKCSFPGMTIRAGLVGPLLVVYGTYDEADTVTGNVEPQTTRLWLIQPGATVGDVVGTCFKLCLTSMEHRTREWFKYRDEAIYHPHRDPDTLVALCRAEKEGPDADRD